MEEDADQLLWLNLTPCCGPVFVWVQQEQGADVAKGLVVIVQLGGGRRSHIHAVRQVVLEPLIGGADWVRRSVDQISISSTCLKAKTVFTRVLRELRVTAST